METAEKQSESLSTRYASVDSLIPYIRNARTHDSKNVALIAGSISEFGFTNPVLADEKGIVAGHGRVLGAQKLYASGVPIKLPNGDQIPFGTVPVVDCSGWSDTKRRAYILADNQIALASGWDDELLKVELADLKLEGFDLDLLGFGDMLTDLLDPDLTNPEKDPDAAPDIPVDPYSKIGDIWVCGPHRVRCGSSTDMGDWTALMGTELADIQVCDPPYNVAYESKLAGKIKNDDMKDGEFYQFLLDFYTCSFAVMKPGAAMYVAHADSEGANFRGALKKAGFHLKSCLMWVKNALVLGRGDFHYRHEPILYATKPGATRAWFGGRKQTTVQSYGDTPPIQRMEDGRYAIVSEDSIYYLNADAVVEEAPSTLLHVPKPKRSAMHPTMKPVALWERLAKNNARANDIIIDGFGGSGTTMIAAERLGMCARLMEFDPKFCDVIAVRYFMYTGRVPVHAETGEPFPQSVIDALTSKWNGA
jgi:DNA modification methylase